MARADILLSLVQTAISGDKVAFTKTVNALIAEEREKNHHILADKLASSLKNGSTNVRKNTFNGSRDSKDLFFELIPQKSLWDLILDESIINTCKEIIEEQHRAELIRSYGIEPRHRILFTGSPGNGKTTLAEAMANELMYPLFVVRYENLIGSYLGETANRLQKIFDYIQTQKCVLFFDEFDTIGKERGDTKETGEIKRVVSSLLLQMDRLPSYVVVITASNHHELLDRAVWRRFQVQLELGKPTKNQIINFLERFTERSDFKINYSLQAIADKLVGFSFSEVEDFSLDILRQTILQRKYNDNQDIVNKSLLSWQNKLSIHKND